MIRRIDAKEARLFITRFGKGEQISFNEKGEFYGCYESNLLVGIVSLLETKNTVRVKSFLVRPDYQDRKIGTGLLFYVLDKPKEYTAFATEKSFEMFKKLGFQEESYNEKNKVRFMRRPK